MRTLGILPLFCILVGAGCGDDDGNGNPTTWDASVDSSGTTWDMGQNEGPTGDLYSGDLTVDSLIPGDLTVDSASPGDLTVDSASPDDLHTTQDVPSLADSTVDQTSPQPDQGVQQDATSVADTGGSPDSGSVPDAALPDSSPTSDTTPSAAQIIITEMMINPTTTDDVTEWFEVFNAGTSPVNLVGWEIKDLGVDSHIIATDLFINPGQYLVLGRSADTGGTVDYSYGNDILLANTADEIYLMNGATEVDRVEYNPNNGWSVPNGSSLSLNPVTADNNVHSNWCVETSPWSAGDKGTPGAAAGCAP